MCNRSRSISLSRSRRPSRFLWDGHKHGPYFTFVFPIRLILVHVLTPLIEVTKIILHLLPSPSQSSHPRRASALSHQNMLDPERSPRGASVPKAAERGVKSPSSLFQRENPADLGYKDAAWPDNVIGQPNSAMPRPEIKPSKSPMQQEGESTSAHPGCSLLRMPEMGRSLRKAMTGTLNIPKHMPSAW